MSKRKEIAARKLIEKFKKELTRLFKNQPAVLMAFRWEDDYGQVSSYARSDIAELIYEKYADNPVDAWAETAVRNLEHLDDPIEVQEAIDELLAGLHNAVNNK